MRNSIRNAKVLGIISAAAGLAASVQFASAQTWNNPNSGNWSTGGNWVGGVAPSSGAATNLIFNATGAQTYSANNDLANPFQVASLVTNNAGTGVITISGNPLTGGIATGGAFARTDSSGAGATALSTGGTVYSLRVGQGLMNVTGGTWTLTSTQRQNDTIAGINDGFWGLNVGDTSSQTSRFSQTGGTINANGFGYFAVADNSTSFGTFNGASTVANFLDATNGRFGVNAGTGSITVENGATVNVRFLEGARQNNATMNMFVTGANSSFNANTQLLISRGNNSNAAVTIGTGGQINGTGATNFFTGSGQNSNSTLTINNGGALTLAGQISMSGGGAANPGTSTLNINGGGVASMTTMFSSGGTLVGTPSAVSHININGGTLTMTGVAVMSGGGGGPSGATNINISNGGLFQTGSLTLGQEGGAASIVNVTISGAGSALRAATGRVATAGQSGGSATVNVNSGTSFTAGSAHVAGGGFVTGVGDPIDGGTAVINVASNATFTAAGGMFFAGSPNGRATINASGANAIVNSGTTDLQLSAAAGSVATTNFSNGASFTGGRGWFMSAVEGGSSRSTFSGNGTTANIAATLVQSGGSQTGTGDPLPGGVSTLTINSGAQFTAGNAIFSSGLNGQATTVVDGANSALTVTAGAGTSLLQIGSVDTGQATFTVSNNAQIAANGGTAQLAVGVAGHGTLNLASGGKANVGQSMFISVNDTSTGFVSVDNGSLTVTRTLVMSGGASSGVGDPLPSGTSTLNVTNAGKSSFENAFIAQNPQARSTVSVSGAGSTFAITSGAGTSNLVIGNDTDTVGTFNVSNGAVASVTGNSFLSAEPGSASTTTVNAGTWTNTGQLQIGGAGTLDGGAAVLNVNNNGFVSASGGTTSLVAVFTPGVVNIGSGTSKGTLIAGQGGVGVDGVINFNAGTFNSVGTLDVAGSVIVSSAARNAAGTPSNKKFIEAGAATLTTSGVIDLDDNDMLLHDTTAGALQKYENFVRTARNNGLWNMPGITSTAAKNSVPKNKNLGVISGANFHAGNGGAGALFNGRTVATTDTLIKFTFNGDTDLNGAVNFDDYARTDGGFNNGRTGWFNGDFDYSGVVNFDDYSLIDQAFNTQGTVVLASGEGAPAGPGNRQIISTLGDQNLSATLINAPEMSGTVRDGAVVKYVGERMVSGAIADGMSVVGSGALRAVPEPGTLGVVGIGALGLLRRRRRAGH